jgi:hypothetical protein
MAEDIKRYGHETPEIAWRRIIVIAALLALMVAIVVIGNYAALRVWLTSNHAQATARRVPIPPEPRLQPHPRADLAQFRAAKHRLLSTYAWPDASHEYARIPIERAMAIYAQHRAGKPARAASAGAPR